MMVNVLDVIVTMNPRANQPGICVDVNLLDVLTTDKYKHLAEACSQLEGAVKRQYKVANVPVITVSCAVDGRRDDKHIRQHTGLICLDFDDLGSTVVAAKQTLSQLPFVAYCGLSISQRGLFVIIPIAPANHKASFDGLSAFFAAKDMTVDQGCHDVVRARYVSYDPAAYYNLSATTYIAPQQQPKPKPEQLSRPRIGSTDEENVWLIVDEVQARQLDFAPDYDTYLLVAFSLSALREAGRQPFHAVCQYSPLYDYTQADKQFDDALKNGCRADLALFFGVAKDYGITYRRQPEFKPYQPARMVLPFSDLLDKWERHLTTHDTPTNEMIEQFRAAIIKHNHEPEVDPAKYPNIYKLCIDTHS